MKTIQIKKNIALLLSFIMLFSLTSPVLAETLDTTPATSEIFTATPDIQLSNLKADGVAVTAVDSQAKKIEGTLTLSDGNTHDWFYQSNTGEKNVLNAIKTGDAFEGAAVTVKVDSMDPSKLTFTIESLPSPMTASFGTLTVEAKNNCFGTDVSMEIPINTIDLNLYDTGITLIDPKADKPSYTVKVELTGGTLARSFSTANLYFDGAFEGATASNLKVALNRQSFTVELSKEVDKDPNRLTQGHLIIGPDQVTYLRSGTPYNHELLLSLTDEYIPRITSGENTTDDTGFTLDGTSLAEDIYSHASSAAATVLNNIHSTGWFSFLGFVDVYFNFLTNAIKNMDAQPSEVEKALGEIQKQLSSIESQIDASTREILGAVDKSDLSNQVNKLSEAADHLNNYQYSYYNANAYKALDWMNAGKTSEHQDEIRRYLEAIYNSENRNFDYLSEFKSFGNMISGSSPVFQKKDIFEVFHGMETYVYDWNSQTFTNREAFNSNVSTFYLKGYTVLVTAIQYDYDTSSAEKHRMEYWINTMQEKIDAGGLNPADQTAMEKVIADYKKKIAQCDENMALDTEQLKILTDTKTNIDKALKASNQRIEEEKNTVAKGTLYSYRLKQSFNKTIPAVQIFVKNDKDPVGVMKHLHYGNNTYYFGGQDYYWNDNGTQNKDYGYTHDIFLYISRRNDYFGKSDSNLSAKALTTNEMQTLMHAAQNRGTILSKELKNAGFIFPEDSVWGLGVKDGVSQHTWGSYGLAGGDHYAYRLKYYALDGSDQFQEKQFLEVWSSFWRSHGRANFTDNKIAYLQKQ